MDDEFLDPLNDTDLFCVHYTIIPQVNHCLEEFTESWNNHSLSSVKNLTPEALFTIGFLDKQQNEFLEERNTLRDSDLSSICLAPQGMEEVTVVDVPNTPAHLCSVIQQELARIPVESETSDFGLNNYTDSVQALGSHY